MRKFKKNPAVRLVVLPPHGRVYDCDILEGDEYAQYSPALLVEIDEPKVSPEPLPQLAPTAEVLVTAPPIVGTTVEVNSLPTAVAATIVVTEEVAAPVEKRKRGRPRKAQ